MNREKRFPPVRLSPPVTLLAAVVLTGAVTLLALWCQPNSLREVLSVFRAQPLLIVLNALPVGLLVLLGTFALRNVFFSAALVDLLVCGLSIGNRVKMEVRDEPVFPRDLGLLKEVGSAMGSYDIRYPAAVIAVVLASVLALAALGLLVGCGLFELAGLREWIVRLTGAVLSGAALAALVFTVYASQTLYNSFATSNPYYVPAVFNELGFPYCFTHHFTAYTVDRPEGFSKTEAEAWQQAPSAGGEAPAVNVVMVMNEAFSDLTDGSAFTYGPENDPLPNLHALRRDPNSVFGHVVVPGFAGGTANTEFDVLTGMQTNALSATTTSALRAVNRDTDSLFRLYGADGYRTSFLHPGDAWFYNRENVFRFLGAEELAFAGDMADPEYKGRWVTDDYLAGLIEEQFEAARADGTPLFSFTTTIQNHMSYTVDKYGPDYEFPPAETASDLSDEVRTLLSVYVEGARDADAMLGRLTDYFRSDGEPVVVVFWGDHLPYLGDGQLAYRELGITLSPEENGSPGFLAAYETPYVIWANDAAAAALDWQDAVDGLDLPQGSAISAAYLGATVAELTGRVEENPWFAFLCELRRELPVVQKETAVLADGSLCALSELERDRSGLIGRWRSWSYYKLKYEEIG